ncbi:site-specific integrase [Aldersonia sp. NBC_00410]|uniref:tyrosine-type recombinase/integrase n=1 Tax=Aldersonia sp. NBC_00410 TaxID=2975954 RepID=UPI002259DCF4|nr:site-specific integrase [Aldersonia sp. NBC_00410]MCX5044090.1 site-specific integrase [Aldersonia sp. NBC_00410]
MRSIWAPGGQERFKGVTLRTYADTWIEQRDLRPRTRVLYRGLLDGLIFPSLGDASLVALTSETVRGWYYALDPSTPTRRAHAYGLLRTILNSAVADELLDRCPCTIRAGASTKRKHEVVVITPAQVDAVAMEIPEELRLAVYLAGWCALRFGEAFELRRGDISPDCSTVSVTRAVSYLDKRFQVGPPKTVSSIRTVSIPPHIRKLVREHLSNFVKPEQDSLLFSRSDGTHVGHHHFLYPWHRATRLAKVEGLRFHDLRHVGATMAARAGGTTAEIQARLGHTTNAAAARYQHGTRVRDDALAKKMSKLR